MIEFGVFYQVYNNKRAVRSVLDNFRKHFPDNPVVLISDGGEDFSVVAQQYDCSFHMRENIFGDDVNKYPKFPYNAYRTIEWWSRQKLVCDETGQDYVMIMEDDVLVQKHFTIDSPFQLRGVRIGNTFTGRMSQDVKESSGNDASLYGMCGGSIYNAKTFLSIYDDVINDIKNNMDRLMEEDSGAYNMLGAVDANITYHFAKRGYIYEVASWLGEVREGNLDRPVIHQWKENY
tara:strand:- start:455 stop:1153 length:699 start_codon:yes stop_codon:yes gene_type:complete